MICRFIDTHCHFDFPPFSGDEEASLQRAAQAGVGKIIVPATEAENFARVLALAENYQPLYAALGLHPGMLEKHSDVSLEQLQQALEGVGEGGGGGGDRSGSLWRRSAI